MQEIQNLVASAVAAQGSDINVEITRPDSQFGDFTTNAALLIANKQSKKPREVAELIKQDILNQKSDLVAKVDIAGPGFINIFLSNQALSNSVQKTINEPDFANSNLYKNQVVVAEYSDPNPFKVLHVGHLYTFIVGDAIANLLEMAGATVHAVNFGGDVGLHVAKAMWGILCKLDGENPEGLKAIEAAGRVDWISDAYVKGSTGYKQSEQTQKEVVELNKKIYAIVAAQDKQSSLAQIFWTCRQWSYDYFDTIYERLGSRFTEQKKRGERVYYPESENTQLGLDTVKQQLKKGTYQTSDGAVVFKGEPYGLHTRVFINSEGLPTYETKDLGCNMAKWRDYHFDKSIIITGNDIVEYMKVVLKSIEQFEPKLATATTHITHGMVRLSGGIKMSSREGNVIKATDVLDVTAQSAKDIAEQHNQAVEIGAVKYAFLKQRLGGDIMYDPKESVSLAGNSGPYIQYAHARACSILTKTSSQPDLAGFVLQEWDRRLALKISQYPEVIALATQELKPHHICTYLYELAQEFNRFYENQKVVGSSEQAGRLGLMTAYTKILAHGLKILGIEAPERM